MVVEYIRYKLEPARCEAFTGAYKDATTELNASGFCLGYELSECEEEPGSFILRIEWSSTEEHLNGFRRSSEFPPFLQKIRPFYADIQEMRHYRLTEIVKKK